MTPQNKTKRHHQKLIGFLCSVSWKFNHILTQLHLLKVNVVILGSVNTLRFGHFSLFHINTHTKKAQREFNILSSRPTNEHGDYYLLPPRGHFTTFISQRYVKIISKILILQKKDIFFSIRLYILFSFVGKKMSTMLGHWPNKPMQLKTG